MQIRSLWDPNNKSKLQNFHITFLFYFHNNTRINSISLPDRQSTVALLIQVSLIISVEHSISRLSIPVQLTLMFISVFETVFS